MLLALSPTAEVAFQVWRYEYLSSHFPLIKQFYRDEYKSTMYLEFCDIASTDSINETKVAFCKMMESFLPNISICLFSLSPSPSSYPIPFCSPFIPSSATDDDMNKHIEIFGKKDSIILQTPVQ